MESVAGRKALPAVGYVGQPESLAGNMELVPPSRAKEYVTAPDTRYAWRLLDS